MPSLGVIPCEYRHKWYAAENYIRPIWRQVQWCNVGMVGAGRRTARMSNLFGERCWTLRNFMDLYNGYDWWWSNDTICASVRYYVMTYQRHKKPHSLHLTIGYWSRPIWRFEYLFLKHIKMHLTYVQCKQAIKTACVAW